MDVNWPGTTRSLLAGLGLAILLANAHRTMAATVLKEDFESIFEDEALKTRFEVKESAGSAWRVVADGGSANSVGVNLPGGQVTTLTFMEKIPAFAGSKGITVTFDTRMCLRWDNGLPFSLPFSLALQSPARDGTALVFHVNYESGTSGEKTEYTVAMREGGSFPWNPASLFENYPTGPGGTAVTGWLRWKITWDFEESTGLVRAEATAWSLGYEGLDEPTKIQTWTFDPIPIPTGIETGELELELSGRARNQFGIDRVDNIVVEREATAKEASKP